MQPQIQFWKYMLKIIFNYIISCKWLQKSKNECPAGPELILQKQLENQRKKINTNMRVCICDYMYMLGLSWFRGWLLRRSPGCVAVEGLSCRWLMVVWWWQEGVVGGTVVRKERNDWVRRKGMATSGGGCHRYWWTVIAVIGETE